MLEIQELTGLLDVRFQLEGKKMSAGMADIVVTDEEMTLSAAAFEWVECVTQTISDEVEGDDRDRDQQPRDDPHPPREMQPGFGILQHRAPGRVRRLNAEPQERKRRFKQDCRWNTHRH